MAKKEVKEEIKEVVKEKVETPSGHPSTMTASQNGTPIKEYAKRILDGQSPDTAITFQLATIEKHLLNQGYEFDAIRLVLTKLQKELI